jgi:arylsulfatase
MAAMWNAWAQRAHVLPLNPQPPKKKNADPDKSAFNHKKSRFALKHGDDLDRFKAPFVEKRAFSVKATVSLDGPDAGGVIVAQGGVTHGWSLYLKNGELCFATTHQGQRTEVRSGEKISGETKIAASLDAQGVAKLFIGDKEVKAAHVPGLLVQQPLDGLQVGQDIEGAVGNYEAPFELQGRVATVRIEIEK